MKKQYGWRDYLKYRFDNQMAKGNGGMIRMLLAFTVLVVVVIAGVITLTTAAEERDFAGSLWDTLAATVNAWMPYSEDGSPIAILLTALAAVAGLLFTSILIGIFSTAIEEKVTGLRDGNSLVLETGHVVVLGFTPGEYTLIEQLIAAARGEKQCILVAGSMPKSEMEENIKENVQIPKRIRLICRSVDTGDAVSLAVCAIPDCRIVVINHTDDVQNAKAALAAWRILSEHGNDTARIISAVSTDAFVVPPQMARGMNLINIPVNDVIARVIARSCTETGISAVYTDLFDIGAGNVGFASFPALAGKTFGEAARTMNGAVPLGVSTAEGNLLNPDPARVIMAEDRLICWMEAGKAVSFTEDRLRDLRADPVVFPVAEKKTVVIGGGKTLKTIVAELPEQPNTLVAVNMDPAVRQALAAYAAARDDVTPADFAGDVSDLAALTELLRDADHVVILSDENAEPDRADTLNILYYLKVAEVKRREGLDLSVTLELRSEKNLQLLGRDEETDFIVAPHIVSMFLAQLTDRPEVVGVFKELLSNRGSELHLKPAAATGKEGTVSCAEVRARLVAQRMLFLGYFRGAQAVMNPDLADGIPLDEKTQLIVLSEK